MASFVSIQDVVSAAVEIEKRGYAFYRSAKKHTKIQELADFFDFMAAEEKKHEAIFTAMLDRVGQLSLPAGSTEAEYLAYVGLLLDSHSLFVPQAEKRALEDPIGQAMALEKDTILFFMGMKNLVPAAEHAHVQACIEEEKKHLRLLAEKAKEMKL